MAGRLLTGSAALLALSLAAPGASFAQKAAPRDLTQTTLEDLMNVQVISVARKEQKLLKTGAAVFVITQDDIHRSGAANIPDVLRMAPGVNVARVDANAWAVSIRGFNSRYSNKIVVLVDGRAIYSPVFSGVYWDQLNVPLESIERIEVIRGPGGTAWGANAMNGVINIITFNSQSTHGGSLVAEAGTQESTSVAQYSGKAGAVGNYRAYGSYGNTDSSVTPAGARAADAWHTSQGGFRTDLELSPQDKVMVRGDLYQTAEGQTVTSVLSDHLPTTATFNDPITVGGGDLQVRWSHTLKSGSETSLNVYYNQFNRLEQGSTEGSKSFDFDFQHHIALNSWNDVVWGVGYRLTSDTVPPAYSTAFSPAHRADSLYSAFAQDEIRLARSVSVIIGTKIEHNAYTGFEFEPSAQFVWAPGERQTLWLSASQAIRQPSRQDVDLQYHDVAIMPLSGGAFGVVKFIGNKDIHAEQLRDYEVGYRAEVTRRLSLDIALFRSYYRRLETTQPADPFFVATPAPAHLVIPLILEDDAHARTYGGEVFATWNVTPRWRLSPGYSLLHINVISDPGNPGSIATQVAGDSPEHQIQLRSGLVLRPNLDWDTSMYYVGELDAGRIPAYTRLDMQLRWRLSEALEFSVSGENLIKAQHTEFTSAFGLEYTQVRRSVLGKITWRF